MSVVPALISLLGMTVVARADDGPVHHDHAHHDHAHHDHAAMTSEEHGSVLHGLHHHEGGATYGASIGMVIADYNSRLFSGDYQGAIVGARWTTDRLGFGASLPGYLLTKNGRRVEGLGDLLVHGHAPLITRDRWSGGVMLMTMIPTGNADQGLGMGHLMFMPELWGGWTGGRLALDATIGYGYALGGVSAHAEHGGAGFPLVGPMNASELTGGASGMVALARTLGVGLHFTGATPVGDGVSRLIGGLRVRWVAGRIETALDIEHGLAGDPFGLRGAVETAIRFK